MRKNWFLWLMVPLILLTAAGCAFRSADRYTLDLTMEGDALIGVQVGQAFTDPGAHATGHDAYRGDEAVEVVCTGTVDTNTPGIYRLEYKAVYQDQVCTAQREVHVVESLSPVIELVADPEHYTLPGAIYDEEGYTATDWLDGDLTAQVVRTEEDGIVTYTVTNSAGLSTTAQRAIRYDDPVPPEILLEGGTELRVPAGIPYEDPGFTAQDNADGDLTALVQVTGSLDIYAPGVYPFTYTVSDNYGNETTLVRNVTVAMDLKNPAVSTGKVIYLTFDDGPGNYAGQLLDVLAKYDVKVSFFVVGYGNLAITPRIVSEGHTVAMHSSTHNFAKIYADEDAFFADLYRLQNTLASYTGQTTYLMRFPGGSSNTVSMAYNKGIMSRLVKSVQEQGFRYFDWNVDSGDAYNAKTADEVFENVVRGIQGKNTAIVLQHDIYGFSVDAVERIIIWGLVNGYTFLPLTQGSPTCAHGTAN